MIHYYTLNSEIDEIFSLVSTNKSKKNKTSKSVKTLILRDREREVTALECTTWDTLCDVIG